MIFSSGGQIAADISLKGSDPGQAAERHEVPALTVRSGGDRETGYLQLVWPPLTTAIILRLPPMPMKL